MGIHDRDYMKRPPEPDDDDEGSWERPGEGAEQFLNRLVLRHARWLKYAGIAILAVSIVAIALAIAGK